MFGLGCDHSFYYLNNKEKIALLTELAPGLPVPMPSERAEMCPGLCSTRPPHLEMLLGNALRAPSLFLWELLLCHGPGP